jgi:signal peptidase I
MASTTLLLVYVLGLVFVNVAVLILFLRLGLKWARVKPEDVTRKRLILTVVWMFVFQLALLALVAWLVPSDGTFQREVVATVVQNIAAAAIACTVIVRMFKVRPKQAFQAWITTLPASIGMLLAVVYLLRPITFEAFVATASSMSPTLLGEHVRGVCPECGELMYRMPVDTQNPFDRPPYYMICDNFHISEVDKVDTELHAADRMIVARFLTPRRWDLVTFYLPEEPETIYVKRLVGLPGETITIENGAVWANGLRLEPPEHLAGIEYWSDEQFVDRFRDSVWGSVEQPAVLGDDEYFVLGDFTAHSRDSRFYSGPPGQAPCAIPESHLYGVVTHIYWPPSRWRVLR